MKREKYLIKNTLILALGNFFPQLTALITLPIYTGMLTKTEYGRYDLVNIIVYILTVVATIQIHQATFRFLIDVRGTKVENTYITNTVCFEAIPSVIAAIAFGMAYKALPVFTQILLGLYLFFNIQYNISGQIARGLGNNKVYAIGSIINSVLNMILVVILVSGCKLGFNGLFISLDAAYLAGTVFQVIASDTQKKINIKLFDKNIIKKMLSYSWPMVPNTLSIWIVNTCNKFIINAFLGLQMNAVFAVAGKIPNIFNSAYGIFNMAWQESASISASDKDSNQYYSTVFNMLFYFLTGCMLLLIAGTPILFTILIRGSYAEAYYQIPLLYIGIFFSSISSFYGSIYIARKMTAVVGISSAIGAIVSCVVNLTLIHQIGIYASSISMIVSYLTLVLYRGIDIEKRHIAPIQYNFSKIGVCLGLIAISSILCYQQIFMLNVVNLILGINAFFILNKNFIFAILKQFKRQ
ncbi:lipopolysaccharide biosynthesis protein [Clostridium sp. BJN0013]|uniref:lipopolysaccharide biosynthesis protein n=1 Tax=Clostridium sp. BJN0013 TaxID=3236840 RepID=UPI0034C5E96A